MFYSKQGSLKNSAIETVYILLIRLHRYYIEESTLLTS